MERKQNEMERQNRQQLENNRQIIKEAATKDEHVEIDNFIDDLFNIPPEPGSDALPPSAFRVNCLIPLVSIPRNQINKLLPKRQTVFTGGQR